MIAGMKKLVAEIHSMGLKIGLYGAASGVTCGNMPGQLYNEDIDAQTYADWGIDYREHASIRPDPRHAPCIYVCALSEISRRADD